MHDRLCNKPRSYGCNDHVWVQLYKGQPQCLVGDTLRSLTRDCAVFTTYIYVCIIIYNSTQY